MEQEMERDVVAKLNMLRPIIGSVRQPRGHGRANTHSQVISMLGLNIGSVRQPEGHGRDNTHSEVKHTPDTDTGRG